MLKYFTNFVCFGLLVLPVLTDGQKINTIRINNPAGIAGDYQIERFPWSPKINNVLTANCLYAVDGTAPVNDACQEVTNNLTGNIAFIDRGICGISDKMLKAQQKGAISVIICNTSTGAPASTVGAGTAATQLVIGGYMMSFIDCQKIKTQILASGVNATLLHIPCTPVVEYADNTIWGNLAGQGDFNGGLNDWVVDNATTWEWNEDGDISKGLFGDVQMTSLTSCNGVMEFNSDYLDQNGLCPAPCTGSLISPIINLPPDLDGIAVEFSQALRQFESEFRVIFSRDGGMNWPDTIRINENDFYTNDFATPFDRVKLPLPGYQNASRLRFKFEYTGNYYYWAIDDVVVLDEKPYSDVAIRQYFVAVPPSFKIPVSQIQEIPLMADVGNDGNLDAEDVVLKATLTKGFTPEGEVIQTFEKYYPLIAAYSNVENLPFDQTCTPPAVVGNYNIAYEIDAPEDADFENNVYDVNFMVTPHTFGKLISEAEQGVNYMGNVMNSLTYWNNQKHYSVGNAFYVKNSTSNGKDLIVSNIRFGLVNPLNEIENSAVKVDLYEWDDIDGDGAIDLSEKILVGTNSVFISGDITNLRSIETQVFVPDIDGSITDDPVRLKAATTYVVMLHTEPSNPGGQQMQFLGVDNRSRENFYRNVYYGATDLAFDSLGLKRYSTSFGEVGLDASDSQNREFVSISTKTAFIEIDLAETSSVTENTNIISALVYPNPASDKIHIDIEDKNYSGRLEVNLTDSQGKTMVSKIYKLSGGNQASLDVSNIAKGMYTLSIRTAKGLISRKVVVL
ncbi:MAG: T9SS type A sorting domain-containing protein [Saprospiraceae bacterium]|nr:T9SS type A sorting domain-containing protein [Saprospiraceae bacterium]